MSSAVMVIDDDFEWDLLFTNLTMAEQRISGGRFTWGTAETLSDDLTCDMRPGSSHQHSTFYTFNIQEESLKTTQTWAIIYHVSLRIALVTYSYTNALLTDAADAESYASLPPTHDKSTS